MKKLIKQLLRKRGLQIAKYPDYDLERRIKLLNHFKIDTLFDIGANVGQYAINMREIGFSKKIISFEPLKTAFSVLKDTSVNDNNWDVYNYALGNENFRSVINVAGNSASSSILNMLPKHSNTEPESRYTTQEEIEIKTLDSIYNSICKKGDSVMIKIDTQGYEKTVMEGATESLKNIKMIQIEMSIVPLYENEILFMEMINYINGKGFHLVSLENGFSDTTTGQLLQVDGIFVKKEWLT